MTKVNAAVAADSSLTGKSLEEIMTTAKGALFNNAAQVQCGYFVAMTTDRGSHHLFSKQVWNHDFYWHSLAPNAGGEPTGPVADAIKVSFCFQTFSNRRCSRWLTPDEATVEPLHKVA